jgi:sec-independent protein translocase protein TatA
MLSLASLSSSSALLASASSLHSRRRSSTVVVSATLMKNTAFARRNNNNTIISTTKQRRGRRGDLVVRNGLFGLGLPEIVVIGGVAALLFGPSKLPELGKSLGKTVKSFQSAANEFNEELKKEVDEQKPAEATTTEKGKEEEEPKNEEE